MKDEKILLKAISIAFKNGWMPDDSYFKVFALPEGDYMAWDNFDEDGWWRAGKYDESDSRLSVEELIYNHDFAKALWGERTSVCYNCTEGAHYSIDHGYGLDKMANWQWHLQQMVIADNPLEYLKDHLSDNK